MLIFRDAIQDRTVGPRIPAFLVGMSGLQRVSSVDGDLLTAGPPWCIPENLDSLPWHALSDNWEVASNGSEEIDYPRYIRIRPDMRAHAVQDSRGHIWFTPAVLDKDGAVLLPMGWGKDENGVRVRKPTDEQAKLIAIASAARHEVEAGTIGSVTVDTMASWAYPLLEAGYHLSSEVFDAFGLVDDRLGVLACISSAGFPKEAETAEAHV